MAITPINMPVSRPPRILVLADTPALGMKMMTTQVIRGLHQRFPEGKIGVLTSEGGSKFYQRSPYPIHIQRIPDEAPCCKNGLHYIAGSIRAGQYDAVIALPLNEYHFGSLAFNEKINFPFRIGSNDLLGGMLRTPVSEMSEEEIFTHDVKHPNSIAAPEEYMGKAMLRYLEPFGVYDHDLRPEAWSSDADRNVVDTRFRDSGVLPGDFLLTLNLCARQGHNQWRMDTLADTAKKISDYWDSHFSGMYGRLVFLANYYNPDQIKYFDRFRTALSRFQDFHSPVIEMPNSSPGELSQIIARSSYVITPETGTAHVAQALDIPATVVYQDDTVKRGWMLPGGRVMPVVSMDGLVAGVPSNEIFFSSMYAILEWCPK